jgi:transcriptional regulator with XRE-family HTH domain
MEQTNLGAKTLKELQVEAGIPVKELARRLGISVTTFATWTSGKAIPSAKHLAALAREFQKPLKVVCAALDIAVDGIPDDYQPE